MGQVPKNEAIAYLAAVALESGEDSDLKRIEFAMKAIEAVPKSVVDTGASVEGGLLFLLSKLSFAFGSSGRASSSFDLGICAPCEDPSSKSSPSASSGTRTLSAMLHRPLSADNMYALFIMYKMVCHATGLADVLAMAVFLEDVLHEPVRSGIIPWYVGFECVIIPPSY